MRGVVLEDAGDVRLESGVLTGGLEIGELDEPGHEDEDRYGGIDEQGSVERAYLVDWRRYHQRECMRQTGFELRRALSKQETQEVTEMPRKAWSPRRERQYEHIKEGLLDRGTSEERAKEIAARTVNKERAQHGETKGSSTRSARS